MSLSSREFVALASALAFVAVFVLVTLVLVVLNMIRLRRVEWRLREIPSGLHLVRVVLERMGDYSYSGGVNGTCAGCPFASEPLDAEGTPYESGDPTEAHYRCFLPGRGEKLDHGKHASCTEREWALAALAALTAFMESRGE